jgi:hypothetical protein
MWLTQEAFDRLALELETLSIGVVHRAALGLLHDFVLKSLLQLGLLAGDLVEHILISLLLVLVDDLLSHFLLQ